MDLKKLNGALKEMKDSLGSTLTESDFDKKAASWKKALLAMDKQMAALEKKLSKSKDDAMAKAELKTIMNLKPRVQKVLDLLL